MALRFDPVAAVVVLTLIGGLATLVLAASAVARTRHRDGNRVRRMAALMCELLALTALLLALFNPSLADQPPTSPSTHLAVILDMSESVLRTPGIWDEAKSRAVDLIQRSTDGATAELLANGRGSIISFSTAVQGKDFPLGELAAELARTPIGPVAGGQGTDLGSALLEAGKRIEKTGRGAAVLVTDGNDTVGSALNAGERLGRLGVPVWVLPIIGGEPVLALDLDLPRFNQAGVETRLRGAVFHHGEGTIRASLAYTRNTGIPSDGQLPVGESLPASAPGFQLETGQYAPLHRSLTFQGLGLQYVDVSLRAEGTTLVQNRRVFTFVDRPISLLAVGGDNSWAGAMPDAGFKITEVKPENLTLSADLSQYDAVVIGGVPAARFRDGVLEMMAQWVEKGLGLMLINGDHSGVPAETPTVLRSYADTPLDRVLPLTADPRKAPEEMPSRYVAIVMDASGSMNGWKLEKGKEIVQHTIRTLLTRRDTLDLIVFTAGAFPLVDDLTMTEANKDQVVNELDSFASGGGTDPREALSLVNTGKDCNLIFLSDGEFDRLSGRPDCKCVAFSIEGAVGPGSILNDLCEQVFAVGPDFNPAAIGLDMLKRKTRTQFWEAGSFVPRTVDAPGALGEQLLPVPALALEGSAIGYKKTDAVVAAFRPKLADPVLAYRQAEKGYAGTVVTAFPSAWIGSSEGQTAIREWILRVVPYAIRDRYEFRVDDLGRSMRLQISVLPQDGTLPHITGLEVQVEVDDTATAVKMSSTAEAPGAFTGYIDLPRGATAKEAILLIEEIGADALVRPQRVPFLLPPAGEIGAGTNLEANTWGLNEGLLRDLVTLTGGGYDPPPDTTLLRTIPSTETGSDIWPWLVLLAAWSYWGAILLRRLD